MSTYREAWEALRKELELNGYHDSELELLLDLFSNFLDKHLFDLE